MSNLIKNSKDPVISGAHFTWAEVSYLPNWRQYATPTQAQYNNMIWLITKLEPLRKEWEAYLKSLGVKANFGWKVMNGARTYAYVLDLRKRGYKAALGSSHIDWKGLDIVPEYGTVKMLWNWLRPRWKGRLESIASAPDHIHLDTWNWGASQTFS